MVELATTPRGSTLYWGERTEFPAPVLATQISPVSRLTKTPCGELSPVMVREAPSPAVGVLELFGSLKIRMRLLPVSATYTKPLESQETPCGLFMLTRSLPVALALKLSWPKTMVAALPLSLPAVKVPLVVVGIYSTRLAP